MNFGIRKTSPDELVRISLHDAQNLVEMALVALTRVESRYSVGYQVLVEQRPWWKKFLGIGKPQIPDFASLRTTIEDHRSKLRFLQNPFGSATQTVTFDRSVYLALQEWILEDDDQTFEAQNPDIL